MVNGTHKRYPCLLKEEKSDLCFVCVCVKSCLGSAITFYVSLCIFLQVCCAVLFVTFHVGGSVDK